MAKTATTRTRKPRAGKTTSRTSRAKSPRTKAPRKRVTSTKARKTSPSRKTAASKRPSTRPVKKRAADARVARKKTAARRAAARRANRPTVEASSRLATAATAMRGAVAGAVAAVAGRLPWGSTRLDAIEMLEQDHRRFEELLAQGEDTTERAVTRRTELLNTLARELNAHELKEEKFLYPVLQAHPQAKDIVLEGYQEHHVADLVVTELHDMKTDDEQWGAKFKVLKENIEHHIREEEGEMFRIARGLLSRDELLALAERMAEEADRT
jgi:hypothetical protein